MPLTSGRLGATRRVGGRRAAINTEIRRAKREGNTGLANSLGGQLAQENLRRADLGISNIGSADSDIRQTRANQLLASRQLAEKAKLASTSTNGQETLSRDPATGEEGETTQPSGGSTTTGTTTGTSTAPSTDVVGGAGSGPETQPSTGGGAGLVRVQPSNRVADKPTVGQIDGLPADVATERSRFETIRQDALAQKRVPNFDLMEKGGYSQEEISEARQQFWDDYEAEHGTEETLKALRQRQAEMTEQGERRAAAQETLDAERRELATEQDRHQRTLGFESDIRNRDLLRGAAASRIRREAVEERIAAREAAEAANKALPTTISLPEEVSPESPTGSTTPEARDTEANLLLAGRVGRNLAEEILTRDLRNAGAQLADGARSVGRNFKGYGLAAARGARAVGQGVADAHVAVARNPVVRGFFSE